MRDVACRTAHDAVAAADGLNLVPQLPWHDGVVLTGIMRTTVPGLANIEPVAEQMQLAAAGESDAAASKSRLGDGCLGKNPSLVQLDQQLAGIGGIRPGRFRAAPLRFRPFIQSERDDLCAPKF